MAEKDKNNGKASRVRGRRAQGETRASSKIARPEAPRRPGVASRAARSKRAEKQSEATAMEVAAKAKPAMGPEPEQNSGEQHPVSESTKAPRRGGARDRAGDAERSKPTALSRLAESSLDESLRSLRSVAESRSLPELLERQSRHMRLMTEIWMRQAHRSMEIFSSMLNRR